MSIMKKFFIRFTSVGLLSLFFSPIVTSAAELKQSPPDIDSVETFLDKMQADEKIAVLPDGSIVSGNGIEIIDPDTQNVVAVVEPETSPLSITVEEYRNKQKYSLNEDLTTSLIRRGSPAPNNKNYNIMVRKDTYLTSNSFSSRGWRFAGYNYFPQSGTGAYLLWYTFKDSAMIGSISEARNTYRTGIAHGISVYPGSPRYHTGPGNLTTYYTYNPIPGASYLVANW
ncbi:hypothetical protein F6324_001549 [Enterococcus faecalis]|jgi:hypothetical protein|nr:hypothetical protein [Enterococcus faecalis]EGO7504831.1 hypothetical protein [Enterococcus faecalis]